MISTKEILYEGKAKQIFLTDDPNKVIIRFKDDATAFNAEKKGQIKDKGVMNAKIAASMMVYLSKKGIPTHFHEQINEREHLCDKVRIIPLEVIIRNVIAGSMAKRLGIPEGTMPKETISEICLKDDALGDPLINDDHAVAIGAANRDQLRVLHEMARKINTLLIECFDQIGIRLVDMKFEFGETHDGRIVLADEVTPDTCRLWDKATGKKLDKDRFRHDLGGVEEAYIEILNRLT